MTEAFAHSAAGSATGYIFQFQVALQGLVDHALANREVAASLEVFDDVAFHFDKGEAPRQIIQVHHSRVSQRALTDRSPKLWRTLSIWAKGWRSLPVDRDVSLMLLTTQTVPKGSALACLMRDDRRPAEALGILTGIAGEQPGSQETSADRKAFLDLEPDQRLQLLNRVHVADGAATAIEMRAELEKALAPTHESRFIPAMADLIDGWWWPRVVRALQDRKPILADELRGQIDEARRSLSDLSLPIMGLDDFDSDEISDPDPAQARFIACLSEIGASGQRVNKAVGDYRRAMAHRSRWARRGLIGPGEIERYEDDLHGEWMIRCDGMLRSIRRDNDARVRKEAGHALWDRVETEVNTPLRPQTANSFIVRGSFHQLAEESKVAWHPDTATQIMQSDAGNAP